MKAIVQEKYGLQDVLALKDVAVPGPKSNEVLVKIHATSVNSWDWDLMTGIPFSYRLISGLFKPKYKIIGSDIAGTVEEVGDNVTQFKIGDEVFGDISGRWGGFAEYVCADENKLTKKPGDMSFEEAAALPQAAVLAYQGLTEKRKIDKGDRILINGAAGGVGTYALQMAKNWGAEVTCVDSLEKLDLLKKLGADQVIDYKMIDFTQNNEKYDLILDVTAKRSVFKIRKALKAGGAYVVIGGKPSVLLHIVFVGGLMALFSNKKYGLLMHVANKNMDTIVDFCQSGKLKSVIDEIYPLKDTPSALQKIGEGKVQGKVVVKIADN